MNSKRGNFSSLIIIFFLFASIIYPISVFDTPSDNQIDLKEILKECADYCEKINRIALFYVCKENVTEKRYSYRKAIIRTTDPYGNISMMERVTGLKREKTKKRSWVYDYQLIRKKGKLEEKRILLEENRKKRRRENAELNTSFRAQKIIFCPVGFLSRYWQKYFDFELIGRDKLEEKEAIVIKALPSSINKDHKDYVKIWVDGEDYSILQIEVEPQSIVNYEEKQVDFEAGDLKQTVIWTVSFGIEKNSVRFPSKQLVQEVLMNEKGEKVILEEILFIYDDYKFFVVESEIIY